MTVMLRNFWTEADLLHRITFLQGKGSVLKAKSEPRGQFAFNPQIPAIAHQDLGITFKF